MIPSAIPHAGGTPSVVGEPREIELRGMPLHAITETECIEWVLGSLERGHGGWVVTANLDFLRRFEHEGFAELYLRSDLRVADGTTLVWGSLLRGTPLPERVTGSQLVVSLSRAAATNGRSVYLLGGAEGAAEGAGRALRYQFPSLRVAGTCCPPLGFHDDARALRELGDALARARPDIVYVALGSPKQEQVIAALRPRLPRAVWLGVGASFSFLNGDLRRAPFWVQRIGFEWFHRLLQEPQRLADRFLVKGIPFGLRFMAESLRIGCQRFELGSVRASRGANAPPVETLGSKAP